jgi:hypothetical protein
MTGQSASIDSATYFAHIYQLGCLQVCKTS